MSDDELIRQFLVLEDNLRRTIWDKWRLLT